MRGKWYHSLERMANHRISEGGKHFTSIIKIIAIILAQIKNGMTHSNRWQITENLNKKLTIVNIGATILAWKEVITASLQIKKISEWEKDEL